MIRCRNVMSGTVTYKEARTWNKLLTSMRFVSLIDLYFMAILDWSNPSAIGSSIFSHYLIDLECARYWISSVSQRIHRVQCRTRSVLDRHPDARMPTFRAASPTLHCTLSILCETLCALSHLIRKALSIHAHIFLGEPQYVL